MSALNPYCTFCGAKLNPARTVWLDKQPFGRDCAKKALAARATPKAEET